MSGIYLTFSRQIQNNITYLVDKMVKCTFNILNEIKSKINMT